MATKAINKTKPKTSSDALYQWVGKDKRGREVKGEMRAVSEQVVASSLRKQGISVLKVKKRRMSGGKSIKGKDIAVMTRQLASMLKAGVPLLQSFDIIARGNPNPSVSKLITDIRTDIETGTSLSNAFAKHKRYFDRLYCAMVAAGESAGVLDGMLDRLALYLEKIEGIKSKIKKALMYPIAVLCVAFIVLTIILLFVVPSFKNVFASFNAELPAPTLIVIKMSEFFTDYWYLIFGILGGAIWGFLWFHKRSVALQNSVDRMMLRVPVFGELMRKSAIARWTRTLSTMFASGVPLVEALESVAGASGNIVYTEATYRIQQDVSSGTSLTMAMNGTQVFPPMVVQMAAVGEESGSLDHMLSKTAETFEEEVDDMVNGLSSLMEPIIIVVLGGLIGGIVVAMYLPIFKMGQIVSGG